jgi:hypothetical protein
MRGVVRVATKPGSYKQFYEGMRDALCAGAPPPIDSADAVTGLAIIEAAHQIGDRTTGCAIVHAAIVPEKSRSQREALPEDRFRNHCVNAFGPIDRLRDVQVGSQ